MDWLKKIFETSKALDGSVLGNPLWLWTAAGVGIIVCYLSLRSGLKFLVYVLKNSRMPVEFHGPTQEVIGRTKSYFLFLLSVYLGIQFLELPHKVLGLTNGLFKFGTLVQIALWADRAVSLLVLQTFTPKEKSISNLKKNLEFNSPKVIIVTLISRFVLTSIVLLMLLDNLGVNITTLVTGLGVGGVAVALAVQNVLGDLFASLSIALDKPFDVGDLIAIHPHTGTVEKIGLKTTRIRLVSGEQLIIGNQEILKNRIQNFKRRRERRVEFSLLLFTKNKIEDIQKFIEVGRHLFVSQSEVRLDRAWVKAFLNGHVEIEWVYTILNSDFDLYMEIQQKFTLGLLAATQELGIELVQSDDGDHS